MYEPKYAQEAIRRSREEKSDRLEISLPKELTPDQRKEEIKHVADFLKGNNSTRALDFGKTSPLNGSYSTLSSEEVDILSKGLARNNSVTWINVKDANNPEVANKRVESVYSFLKADMKREAEADVKKSPQYRHYRRKSNSIYNIGKMEKFEHFFRTEEKLKKYTEPNSKLQHEISDAMRDITKNSLEAIVSREVLDDDTMSQGSKNRLTSFARGGYDYQGNLKDSIEYTVMSKLFDGMDGSVVKAVSDNWHTGLSQTKMLKEKDFSGSRWNPLFGEDKKVIDVPPQVIGEEGWQLVSLTDADELKKEGEKLDHCVGGYASRCMEGKSHIVSIRRRVDSDSGSEYESVSTMEFQLDYNKQDFKINQNYGRKNTTPPQEALDIEKALKAKLGKSSQDDDELSTSRWRRKARKPQATNQPTGNEDWDNISINYAELQRAVEERSELDTTIEGKVKKRLGYDVQDDKKLKKVQKVYSEVLAPKMDVVTDNDGVEIPNYGPEVRKELRDRFKSLLTEPFSIAPLTIGGKSEFGGRQQEEVAAKKPKKEKVSHSEEQVLRSVQGSVNSIFQAEFDENAVAVSIDKSDGSKFGKIKLSVPQGSDASKMKEALEGVFANNDKVSIKQSESAGEEALEISGMQPLPASRIMKNYAQRNAARAIAG